MKAWLIAGALAAAGTSSSGGQPPIKPGGEAPAKSDDRDAGLSFAAHQLTGQLQSVAEDRRTIVISREGQAQNVTLTDETTVFVDGRLGGPQDLEPGARVRAALENEEGSRVLRWIEVVPASAGKPATAANGEGSFTGHIVSIDTDKHQVTVAHGDAERTVSITPETKIVKTTGEGRFEDLKAGQDVRASFSGDKLTLLEVVVAPPKEESAKPPAGPKEPAPPPATDD